MLLFVCFPARCDRLDVSVRAVFGRVVVLQGRC
jgi:hypothetical protein